MRKILLLFIFTMWCKCSVGANTDSLIIIQGRVVDAAGAYLPYVKIRVEGTEMYKDSIALTDRNGEFNFRIGKNQDKCMLVFSYLGFKDRLHQINTTQNNNLGEISMQEDPQMLAEVQVKGEIVHRKKDRTIYFPTKKQSKASNNGSRLLYNLMIPELTVDYMSGNASTKDGKFVTQCINGTEASMEEIKALRAKDIIRIDFYATPTGQFSQYQAVVDYVVKTYESGGYAVINTSNTFLTPAGNYDFSSKYHIKRWDFNILGGIGNIKDTKQHSRTEENIGLNPAFQRISETASYYWKRKTAYGALKATYSHKLFYLSVLTGYKWNRVPKSISVNDVYYSNMQYFSQRDSTSSYSRSVSPYMKFFLRLQVADNDYLVLDGGCSYANNVNKRYYNEKTYLQPIISNTDEDNYNVRGNLYYWHNFKDYSYISTGFTVTNTSYKDQYSGTTNSYQTSGLQTNSFWVKYRKTFNDKLYSMFSLSLYNANTTINQNILHEWKWMPNIFTEYSLEETSKLSFECSMSCLSPSQSSKTPIRQRVNSYEFLEGNEDLCNYNQINGQLAYTKYWGNINIFANIAGAFFTNSIQDVYYSEDNSLIHTFQRGGSYSFTGMNLWATAYLLNKSLQINGGGCYQIVHSNDIYRKNLNTLFWGIHMLYMLGNISFSANFDAEGYGSSPSTSTYSKGIAKYGFGATYNAGNLYVSLTAANIFNKHPRLYSYMQSPIYQRTAMKELRAKMASINLSLTYTIDFEHKKQTKENVNLDNNINNGILKIE